MTIPDRLIPLRLALGVLLALLASPAGAQVFYDNLGNVDVFDDTDVVSFIGDHTGANGSGDWYQGYRFTSAASGEVHSIDVAVGNWTVGPETMEFRLYADAGGSLGALLATIPVVAVAEDFDGTIRRGRVPAAGVAPVLTQGVGYWLMAYSPGPTLWFNNEQGVSLPRLWTPGGLGGAFNSDTTTAAAFRVNGPPPVPIAGPIGWLMLAGVLVGTGGLGVRAMGAGRPG